MSDPTELPALARRALVGYRRSGTGRGASVAGSARARTARELARVGTGCSGAAPVAGRDPCAESSPSEGALQPARVSRAPVGCARVAYYAHHLRPAWKLAPVEVTTVHDTIPFRYPPSRALAPLMRSYIGWMAAALDARRHRLGVLEAEPRDGSRTRPGSHRRAEARHRSRSRRASPRAAVCHDPRRSRDVRRARRAAQEPRSSRARRSRSVTSVRVARCSRSRASTGRRSSACARCGRELQVRVELPGIVSQSELEAAAGFGHVARATFVGGGLRVAGGRGARRGYPGGDQHRARPCSRSRAARRSRRSIPATSRRSATRSIGSPPRPTSCRSSNGRGPSTSPRRC